MSLSRIAIHTFAAMLLSFCLGPLASAGDWEDGYASYMRGDYETALAKFMSLANEGSALAMDMLSIMYSNGEGVAPNYAEAARWSEQAEAQRSADTIEKSQGTNNAGSNK